VVDIEEVRSKMETLLAKYHDYDQVEWTGGDSHNPRNHRVPAKEVAAAFRLLNHAWKGMTRADHFLALWLFGDQVPSLKGDAEGAEWFQERFVEHDLPERRYGKRG